jgi:hypothetical protein
MLDKKLICGMHPKINQIISLPILTQPSQASTQLAAMHKFYILVSVYYLTVLVAKGLRENLLGKNHCFKQALIGSVLSEIYQTLAVQ